MAVRARRDEVWTQRWLRALAQAEGSQAERVPAIFDAFDEWFRRDDYEGCLFINVLAESRDRRTPVGEAAADGLVRVRRSSASWPTSSAWPSPNGSRASCRS